MLCATTGPTSATSSSCSTLASMMRSSAPKCARQVLGRGLADVADAQRVQEARAASCCLLFSSAGDQVVRRSCRPCAPAPRAWPRRACTARAGCATMPPSTSWSTSLSPRPSMSMRAAARRSAGCACLRCAGQNRPPLQRQSTSPSSRAIALPHTGHWPPSALAQVERLAASAGRLSARTPTTSGITSPARRTITVSPMRTSLRRDLVLVVQRGVADRRAADEHRLQLGHRRELAGAADLDVDAAHARHLLLRRVLVRHRPARLARHEAEPLLQRAVVDLVDHAVDVEGQRVALRGDAAVEGDQPVGALAPRARSALTGRPMRGERVEQRAVRGRQRPSPAPRRGRRRRSSAAARAAIAGSSWRTAPAAALRGLTKVFSFFAPLRSARAGAR